MFSHSRRRARTAGHYFIKYGTLVVMLTAFILVSSAGVGDHLPLFARHRRTLEDTSDSPAHDANVTCENVENKHGLIPYLSIYYCSDNKAGVWVFFVLWLLVLFYLLGTSAEGYFCPSLDLIADVLRMSPELHGVTILSLGNGVADVSSTVVSALSDSFELGIGETFGAGLFIVTVIVAAVTLSSGQFSLDRNSFLRDIIFYLLAVVAVFFIWWDGKIFIYECMAFLGYYVAYVLVAVLAHYCCGGKSKKQIEADAKAAALPQPKEIPAINDEEDGRYVRVEDDSEDSDPLLGEKSTGPEHKHFHVPHPTLEEGDEDDDERERNPWTVGWFKATWYAKAPIQKILYIVTYLLRLPLIITTPTIRWNRYITSLIPVTAPALVMLVLGWGTFTKTLEGDVKFPIVAIACICGLPLSIVAWFTSTFAQKPKYYPVVVILCFLLSIGWIYLSANELIALLQSVGEILSISDLILGATVLSWGNSIGDLVADVLMAKQGQPQMAVAATYASPLFNMLIGFGAALAIATAKAFPNAYEVPVSNLFILTGAFLMFAVWTSLIIISARKFRMHWAIGIYLLALYVTYTVLIILVEKGIIWEADSEGTG